VLKPYVVNSRAPVVLADKVEWIPDARRAQTRRVRRAHRELRKAWVARTRAYLTYYGTRLDPRHDSRSSPAQARA